MHLRRYFERNQAETVSQLSIFVSWRNGSAQRFGPQERERKAILSNLLWWPMTFSKGQPSSVSWRVYALKYVGTGHQIYIVQNIHVPGARICVLDHAVDRN